MENSAHAVEQERVGHAVPQVLSPDELDQYRRDGFLVPKFRLSADEVRRLHRLISKLVADNPHKIDHIMNSPHVPGAGGLKSGPGWLEFATHPVILDMIEQIMGPDIILRGTIVFYKR